MDSTYYAVQSDELQTAEALLIDVLRENGNCEREGHIHHKGKQDVCQIFYKEYGFWSLYIPNPKGDKAQNRHLFAYGTCDDKNTQKNICQTNICLVIQRTTVGGVLARGGDKQFHLLQRGTLNSGIFGKKKLLDEFKHYGQELATVDDQGKKSSVLYIGPLTKDLICHLGKFVETVAKMRKDKRCNKFPWCG